VLVNCLDLKKKKRFMEKKKKKERAQVGKEKFDRGKGVRGRSRTERSR